MYEATFIEQREVDRARQAARHRLRRERARAGAGESEFFARAERKASRRAGVLAGNLDDHAGMIVGVIIELPSPRERPERPMVRGPSVTALNGARGARASL